MDLGAAGANWTLQNTARGIAVARDRSQVYITVPRISALAVADVNTNRVVAAIPVAAGPNGVAAAPASSTLVPYVVDAVDDTATVSGAGGIAATSVLVNDRLGGVSVTPAHVGLQQVASTDAGLTLDLATGAVEVAPGTPVGQHTLDYQICELSSPSNCDVATVTVTVREPHVIILAVNDMARGSSRGANSPLASVLANDTLGGERATTANVKLSLVSLRPAKSKIRLDPTDGSVDVLGRTRSGTYTLVYRICEVGSPNNCSQATVTLELSGRDR
jgi:hypothetical protein